MEFPTFATPQPLLDLVAGQKHGSAMGITSVCSANRFVIQAALRQAAQENGWCLVEATCNQVNPFGGYTGLTPADFAAFVAGLANDVHFPTSRILLGGDHLGPFPWQHEPAETAMAKSVRMVKEYVRAGFRKIHLDASMHCADDDPLRPLDKVISARRAAEMCQTAEQTYAETSTTSMPPVYVIGTEVPTPGGTQEKNEGLQVTKPEEAAETIALFHHEFIRRGLESAWERVIALVVQPGVEFGGEEVVDYNRPLAQNLSRYIETVPGLVFEAHSTDYQKLQHLRQLVQDHFAILKVGPALSFAFREAVFALASIEREWLGGQASIEPSTLIETVLDAMHQNPSDWQKYYMGTPEQVAFACKYSFSDRIRYYWNQPKVEQSLERLIHNLENHPAPVTVLSQYMPNQYKHLRSGQIGSDPRSLIWDHIQETLSDYSTACGIQKTQDKGGKN
jgi:D-tagatose-1,6-bisphosphate aldolase subunit GatZ/KbaZ